MTTKRPVDPYRSDPWPAISEAIDALNRCKRILLILNVALMLTLVACTILSLQNKRLEKQLQQSLQPSFYDDICCHGRSHAWPHSD